MDAHPDDLSDLERRLTACRPAADGLNADAMLFAAGRAAGASRFPWPALSGLLAVLALGLGVWAMAERAERLALSRPPPPSTPAPPEPAPAPTIPSEPPSAAGEWLSARRALEQGLDAWPPHADDPPTTPGPLSPVLMAGQRDSLLDP